MRRPLWNCGAALVLLALVPSSAGAGDADIRWSAPDGCPDRDAFVAQLDEFLGIPVDSLNSVHIDVAVAPGANGWHLVMKLRVHDDTGERAFDGADCAELVASAAISAALSLDPSALELEPERRKGIDGVWDGERPPDVDLTAEVEPPPVQVRTPGPELDASARLQLGADANSMPHTSVAVGLMVGLQYWRIRVEGGPMWWPTQVRNDQNDAGIEVSRFMARLAGCIQYWWAHGCLIGELGDVTARSFGYTDIFGDPVDSELNSGFDWAGGGTLGISIPMGKTYGFRVDTEIVGGGFRPRLTVPGEMPTDDKVLLYQRPVVVFRAFAGVEVVIR